MERPDGQPFDCLNFRNPQRLAPEDQPYAQAWLIVLENQVATVQASNRAYHGEAKPAPFGGARFLKAAILADRVLAKFLCNSRAPVPDDDCGALAKISRTKAYRAPRGGIFHGVVDEVGDRPAYHLTIADECEFRALPNLDRQAVLLRHGLVNLANVAEQLREVEAGELFVPHASLGPADLERRGDDAEQ